jgi:hypothetical protein
VTIAQGRARLGLPPVMAYQRLLDEWARVHRITVTYDATLPRWVGGWASWKSRQIALPGPVRSEVDLAVAAHEIGHVLAGACSRQRPHYRDPAEPRWWNCVQCELEATQTAMRIGAAVWTKAMHRKLASSLRSYRLSTPTWPAQVHALETVASDLEFFRVKHTYVMFGTVAACRERLQALTR